MCTKGPNLNQSEISNLKSTRILDNNLEVATLSSKKLYLHVPIQHMRLHLIVNFQHYFSRGWTLNVECV